MSTFRVSDVKKTVTRVKDSKRTELPKDQWAGLAGLFRARSKQSLQMTFIPEMKIKGGTKKQNRHDCDQIKDGLTH